MAADRDLLFGLLALQNGLIQQTQLVAAFHAWTCNKSRSLADHLLDRGDLDADDRGAVEALVAHHLKRHGGGVEQSLAAVPAGRAVRASLAALGEPEIEATLARVARSKNGPVTEAEDDDPDRTASIALGSATSDGQRFRILRPHARGGLGEVFVALDGELHREVALKQILEKHADDPVSRQRFVAEAEITGGLEHPGVVPVYGLGTDAEGRPYYAMRFIKGDSLKEAIARFQGPAATKSPSPLAEEGRGEGAGVVPATSRDLALRKLLRRFTDVCNAIDYAHSRGVIHRDVKPANIILGKHGETLVVDWGLAKSVGRADPSAGEQTIAPSSGGSSETLPGSALGTPAYMSPEQARGDLDRLGPRSDVYSLGATLYCLLTGKPPFEGEDIGEILRNVQEGDIVRPGQVDSSIDKALEAVCLKAMALHPSDRYASPRLLAEDIERWMADEPVTAWCEPWTRRLLRWLTQHRTSVTGATAAVLAGVLGLLAVLAVQSAANVRLSESLKRETDANAELRRSKAAVQARYDLAVEAVKTLHTGVSEDFLLKEERFKDVRDRFLKSASDFYGKLSALLGKETDVASRRALAQSNFELAELTRKVGRQETALAAHRAVLEAREALAAARGADTAAKVDVGRSLTEVAALLDAVGKTAESLETYRRSESLLASLASSDPAAQAALAACRSRTALQLFYWGRAPEALAALERARADQEVLAAVPGASNDARRELAETVTLIGFMLWNTGRAAEAVPVFREALAMYQKLADENPAVIEFRRGLAVSHFYVGNVLSAMGELADAEVEMRTALKQSEDLLSGNPAVNRFLRTVALNRCYLGKLLASKGEPDEAEAQYRKALAVCQKLVDNDPGFPQSRSVLAECRRELGIILLQMGKPAAAEAECRSAVGMEQRLTEDNPALAVFRDRLAGNLSSLGDVVRSLGRVAEARELYERAMALTELRARENPTDAAFRGALAGELRRLGLTLRDLANPAGAAADIRRALALCDELPPGLLLYELERAFSHAALAGLAGWPGSGVSVAEGEIEAARAMEWLRRAVAMGYRNVNEFRIESALDQLRSRDDFRQLMMDMAFPAEPFAPPQPIP